MSSRRRGQLYIAAAAVAWSTAGGLQRELTVDTPTQLAGRALVAFLALAAFVALRERGRTLGVFRSMGIAGLGVAVCTAIASGSFIVALNHATVANVLFMQAVSPIAAALLAWAALGEPVTRRAGLAMLVALVGMGLMVGGPGSGGLFGFGASAVMTLSYSVGIVITRHRRDVSMTPAICLSQLLLVLVAGPFAQPSSIGEHDLFFLVLMGVGQMGLGLVLFAMGARLIVASEVALITLLEVVLGPFWAWVAVSEKPALMTVVGGGVVVVAVLLQTTGTSSALRRRRASERPPRSRPDPAALPAPDPSGTESGATERRRE
ncbi:MAG TPA: DMT family transporter [Gaiellaceae bacterium]|nr:DMT family transporter [Gaiellaceae bacterium]